MPAFLRHAVPIPRAASGKLRPGQDATGRSAGTRCVTSRFSLYHGHGTGTGHTTRPRPRPRTPARMRDIRLIGRAREGAGRGGSDDRTHGHPPHQGPRRPGVDVGLAGHPAQSGSLAVDCLVFRHARSDRASRQPFPQQVQGGSVEALVQCHSGLRATTSAGHLRAPTVAGKVIRQAPTRRMSRFALGRLGPPGAEAGRSGKARPATPRDTSECLGVPWPGDAPFSQ
jgi:hypothetical protein